MWPDQAAAVARRHVAQTMLTVMALDISWTSRCCAGAFDVCKQPLEHDTHVLSLVQEVHDVHASSRSAS
jgi:hypothetical protein